MIPSECSDSSVVKELGTNKSSQQGVTTALKSSVSRMLASNIYFSSLHSRDRQFRLSPEFLSNKKTNPKMRAKLVKWMDQLHQDLGYKPQTFFLAVTILDKYLSVSEESPKELQLAGATVLFIASKIVERNFVSPQAYSYSANDAFTPAELLKKQKSIMARLGFKTDFPLAIKFVKQLGMELSPTEYTECVQLLTMLDESVDSYSYSRLQLAQFVVVLVKTGQVEGLTLDRLMEAAQRLDKLFD